MCLLPLNAALKVVSIFSRNVWKASDAAMWMKGGLAKTLHKPPSSLQSPGLALSAFCLGRGHVSEV